MTRTCAENWTLGVQIRDRDTGSDGLIVLLSSGPKAPANNYQSF